jgi:glycine cleavage system H lipoate-binding protein
MGDGWFYKMTIADSSELAELMSADAYKSLVESES